MARKNRKTPDKSGSTPHFEGAQPGRSAAGQEVRPEAVQSTPGPECAGGAVPIGLPIPQEEYVALQKKAKHRSIRPHDAAQEDTA